MNRALLGHRPLLSQVDRLLIAIFIWISLHVILIHPSLVRLRVPRPVIATSLVRVIVVWHPHIQLLDSVVKGLIVLFLLHGHLQSPFLVLLTDVFVILFPVVYLPYLFFLLLGDASLQAFACTTWFKRALRRGSLGNRSVPLAI